MSWPHWPAAGAPLPGVVTAPAMQSAVLQGGMNSSQLLAAGSAPGIHYTPEQWAQMQQQNWQQWAQWQQQYQQWHQQYGVEYSKSINAISANQAPPIIETNTSIPPPPPNETKPPPPPPPDDTNRPVAGYMTAPPPNPAYNTGLAQTQNRNQWQSNKRPLAQPGSEFESGKRQMMDDQGQWSKTVPPPAPQQPKAAANLEELTQAEQKFDKEFAAWEAQFNKWKEQNANHPDKTQFLEYEKKWESWRNSLLERREQMRKKRLALQATLPPKTAETQVFTELPPAITQVPPPVDNPYSKPPPTQNNEPLAFKASKVHPIEQDNENSGADFLKSASPTSGGIPGLDLVKDGTAEEENDEPPASPTKGPDFDAISKGINTILGDTKLMNMLSMVQQKYTVPPPPLEDQYKPSQRETVNNFDDQTQMSFSGGQDGAGRGSFDQTSTDPKRGQFNQDRFNFNQGRRSSYETRQEQDHGFNQNRRGNFNQDFSQTRKGNFDNRQEQDGGQEWRGFNHGRRNNYDNRQDQDMGYNQNRRSNFDGRSEERAYNQDRRNNYNSQHQEENDWNEDDSYDRVNDSFADEDKSLDNISKNNEASVLAVEEGALFVPEVVIDYEHKALKEPEPEISLEPLRMFDYRHKNVNRIPYPQRPVWLTAALRNIRQFDPLGGGRYPPMYERDLNYRERDGPRQDKRHDYENDKDFRAQGRDGDYGRRYGRFDDSPRNRDSRWRNRDRNSNSNPRDRTDRFSKEQKPLDLEEFSDGDWSEDNATRQEDPRFSSSPEIVKVTPAQGNRAAEKFTLEQVINVPGRYTRPQKIVIILRGPPGSGKTYLAKLIKDREVENGGSAPRILSLDDYFMVEQEKEVVQDGKTVRIKEMVYEYEAEMEETYRQSLTKSFKKTITDGYFNFIVVDNVNQKVKNFGEMWSFAKQNGFQVYICELDLDPQLCSRRNVHNRSQKDIEDCIAGWEPTPSHHPTVDPTEFLQSCGPIAEVEMEEVEETNEEEDGDAEDHIRSKWDTFDCSLNNLARLDGVNKPLRSSKSMEEYLQLDEEWTESSTPLKPGQKRVRWADLEEQKQQKKMKALGFVVGHTDWNRIMDPTNGESALIQTKYIERVRRY